MLKARLSAPGRSSVLTDIARPAAFPMAVLVAVSDNGRERIAKVLRGRPLEFVATCAEAKKRLHAATYELVVIGAHFDESSSLQLLQEVLELRPAGPIICVRVTSTNLGRQQSFDAFRTACSALGAAEALDLLAFPDDEAGNARVSRMLDRLIDDAPA